MTIASEQTLRAGVVPMGAKAFGSVSLDLDNHWSYIRTHGDPGWESFPSYLEVFVPYTLEALDRLGLKITVFVVGQDAALERNHDALRLIARNGHEIGNHSFHHHQWMLNGTRDEIRAELAEAADAIEQVTGQRPKGYRAPGFCWSSDLLEVLAEEGYAYDASTFPTYIGPLARRYYFRQAKLTAEQREKRKDLFGGFGEGRLPYRPYWWKLRSGRTLLEMPVTTMPLLKIPFHLSYLLHLSRYSSGLMMAYLRSALTLCHLTRTEPSFLLHPLDLLGREHAPGLEFFPGMDLSSRHKLDVFHLVLSELGKHFTLVTLGEHAQHTRRGHLRERPASGSSWKKEPQA